MQRTWFVFLVMAIVASLASCDLLNKGQRENTLTLTLSTSTGPVNASVILSARGRDVSQFQWSFDSRPLGDTSVIANPTSQSTSFSPQSPGHYLVRVTAVQDGIAGTVFVSKPFDAY